MWGKHKQNVTVHLVSKERTTINPNPMQQEAGYNYNFEDKWTHHLFTCHRTENTGSLRNTQPSFFLNKKDNAYNILHTYVTCTCISQ